MAVIRPVDQVGFYLRSVRWARPRDIRHELLRLVCRFNVGLQVQSRRDECRGVDVADAPVVEGAESISGQDILGVDPPAILYQGWSSDTGWSSVRETPR